MSHQQIRNLADLRQRKAELKLEMKFTRQALDHRLQYTRMGAQRFFIYGLLVPLGLNSLASLLFDKENAQGEKPQWLLFVEQMIETVSRIYEAPETAAEEEGE